MDEKTERMMEDKVLRKVYITDNLQLLNILKPSGEQEAVMYIVSSIDGEFARRLLNSVVWESHIHTPEIATVVSTVSRQNISSKKRKLPALREGEGFLSVMAKTDLDSDAPLELDWHLVVLAYSEPFVAEEEDEEDDPSILDCSSCAGAVRCFKSDIEA